ncbi:MAG: aryl-sulfate sulfotransferase [Nannocystales bacterium]
MRLRWLVAALVFLSAGCGDDVSVGETDSGSSSTQTPSTGVDAATASDAASSTSSSSSSSSSGGEASESTTTEADTSSSGGELSTLDVEVALYPEQPMVVDITLVGDATLPDDLELTHDTDDGVRIAVLENPDGQTRTYRARGLSPLTQHELTAATGALSVPVSFTTEAPLPGFIQSFEVTGESVGERPYRMFDLSPFPASSTSSVFVVDPSGTTRWHFGYEAKDPFPGRIDAVTASPAGTVHFAMQNRFVEIDELGAVVTEVSDDELGVLGMHHEALVLPSGNIVVLAYSFQEVDYPGAPNTLVAGDVIVEFTPDGDVVWTWDTFDHLDPQRVLEPIDGWTITHPQTEELAYDWTHGNGVIYQEDTDQFMLSLRHQDWLVAIDRASSDVDWILGPGGDFSLTEGTWFAHQHSPQWQPDGSLLLYDNAVQAPSGVTTDALARAVRYELDLDAFTISQVWELDQQDVSSPFAGDSNLLPESGHYVVLDSTVLTKEGFRPRLRELDPVASPMVQWTMDLPPAHLAYRTSEAELLVGESR